MTRTQAAILALAGASFGWWAHAAKPVHADSPDLRFEFSGIGPTSALSVYNPADQSIYVYQGATSGFATLQCSYRFHVPRAGAPIERQNCAAGSIH